MLEWLVDAVTASAWVYPLILAIVALDAVFPLVPSEATVITAAALAGAGELVLGFVLLSGAAGAIVGDNFAYMLGRAGRGFVLDRISKSPKWRQRVRSAQAQLERRGGTIIVVSRFVPGGRTATMISAGIGGLSWRRFIASDLVAALVWAGYGVAIGWVGGKAFADKPLYALLLAFALALALTLLIESGRRLFRATTGP
jgi:membrane protein DedA with SNARE-associated domain